jgi:phage/plasmid-associated DNA primase
MDPETFEQTAKVVILSNHIPTFDEPDLPLCDRLYVINSSGRFVKNADPDPDMQRKEEMYQEDTGFWNDERKQALAYIMLHEGFHAYIKEGLTKTPAQIEALKKWQTGSDPYMSFAQVTKETHNRIAYLTDAIQVYDMYKQKNLKAASSLSYEKFKSEFAESTGHRVIKIGDTEFYGFYHPSCDTRFDAREMMDDMAD